MNKKTQFEPKVSIIIPVYNGSNYLQEAIDSALSQTYKNIEVIVVNDGSSDGGKTEGIALENAKRIRYFSKDNGGVSSALNLGIEKMTGDYFSWLSHDDLYKPEKIKKQIEALAKLGDIDNSIIYSDYEIHNIKKNVVTNVNLKNTAPNLFRYSVAVGNDLNGCTMLVPKIAFKYAGMFSTDLRAVQDYQMWFRLSERYTFFHLSENLVTGRAHDAQVGVRLKGMATVENNKFRIACLDALGGNKIAEATLKSEVDAYLYIADLFSRRELYQASSYALKKALNLYGGGDPIKLIKNTPEIVLAVMGLAGLFIKNSVRNKILKIINK